jgi:ACS family tartrate transporter-like MFS transporter
MSLPLALDVEHRARRRIALRLLPFLWLLYVVAFLDRVNVAYAALEMSHDLRFSDQVFGTGAGIFFIGYVLLEIPGALIVERWSARRWIARIMVSWGIITVLVGFVHTSREFYFIRFLLGAAEAGFFPGVIVYLTHWFSRRDLAKAVASFMAAQPLANLVGSPLAGRILQIQWRGLEGWRWLFILEGIPAVVLGVVTIFYLTDWPSQAGWLPREESDWITGELNREKKEKNRVRSYTIAQALLQREVILLTLVYFLSTTGVYGFTIWFPTILKRASGLSIRTVTFLVALPYLAALAATLLNGWHSDRIQERRWHTFGLPYLDAVRIFYGLCRLSLLLSTLFLGAPNDCTWRVRRSGFHRIDQFSWKSGGICRSVYRGLPGNSNRLIHVGFDLAAGQSLGRGRSGAVPAGLRFARGAS